MPPRLLGTTLLLLGAGLACLRSPPGLAGKLCTPGSSECGAGLACATQVGGLPLPSLDAGLCSPLDAGCGGLLCPPDAGLWICDEGRCFAEAAPELGGAPCTSGLGRCRGSGLFLWTASGGTCLIPDAGARSQPECSLVGPHGPRCPCDGVDDDCDGLADDVPPRAAFSLLPQALPSSGSAACADADGGVALVSLDGGLLAGTPVGGCAVFDLEATYALDSAEFGSQLAPLACGVASPSGSVRLEVFSQAALDGGFEVVGTVPGSAGRVPIHGRVRRLAVCTSANASFSGVEIHAASLLPAQSCDTDPP